MSHLPALDGLRAFAVAMVLLTHFWPDPQGWTVANRLFAAGWIGVDLFFVLSGFLITRILVEAREQPNYFRNFFARRALRIFPLYYAVLTVVFVVLPLLGARLPARVAADQWMYWAYLSNVALAAGGWHLFLLDITWSLAIEEQFYLLWPAIVRWTSRGRLAAICAGLVVLVPMARFYAWNLLEWSWLHMLTPFRIDTLALGGLIGLVTLPRAVPVLGFVAGGGALLLLVVTGQFARDSATVATFGYTLTAVTSGAALLLALNVRWLAARPLRYIGTISYGMYLLHPLCLALTSGLVGELGVELSHVTGAVGPDAALAVVLPSCVTILAATVSYYVWETPFLRLKRHFGSAARLPQPIGVETDRLPA